RRAGLRYYFFSRDLPPEAKDSAKNLFYWRSPDGSKLLAHLAGYGTGLELRSEQILGMDMQAMGPKALEELIRRNPEGNDKIMLPWGSDEYLPTATSEEMEKRVRQAASKIGIPVK